MPWTISARVNLFDEELAGYLKKTFCSDIGFGIESYDQNILDSINKKVKIEEIDKAISICKQFELNYSGSSFMVGYFDENEETIKKSSEFAMKNNLRYEPHFMTPYPGTKLYEFARQKGLIIDEVEYIKRIALQGNTSSLILNLTNHLSDEQLTIYRNKYIFFPLPAKGKITFSRILNLKNYAFRDIYKKISNLIFKSSKTTPLIEDTNSNIWI